MNLERTVCHATFWKHSTLWHIIFINIYIIVTILQGQYFGILFVQLILTNTNKD